MPIITKAANKNKATHSGSCQICGSGQKLPHGVLAKHGYTTKWGFFSGTCNGAGHLPFEVSCDLIEEAINSATLQCFVITERIAGIRERAGTKAWVNHYGQEPNGYKSSYRQVECEIVERPIPNGNGLTRVMYVGPDGKDHQTGNYGTDRSVAGTVAYLNDYYIKSVLQTRIVQLKQYIAWQKGRIADWKPAELTPVK